MKSTRQCVLLFFAIAGGLAYAQPVITSVVDPYTGGTKFTPGGQALITGTNLGSSPAVSVGGINGFTLAPPLGGTQITFQIPVNATPGASVPVIVTTGAGPSAPFNIAVTQYAPVLISQTSGALTSPRHGNGVAVATSTPAAAGETITVYAIGLGPTTPTVNTGQLGPPSPFALTTTTPTVTFGSNAPVNAANTRLANGQAFFGANAPSGLVGTSQGFIGIYQFNVTVPAGTAAGNYALTLSIGGATSNAVQVAVGTAPAGPVISAIVGESGKTALCPGDVAILSGLNLGTNPTVTIGGKTAFNVNPPNNANQMTIQIPVDAPTGPANVTVALGNGQISAAFPITLSQFAPVLSQGGNGNPLLPFHANNGTQVTNTNPAVPGETIFMLAYGLGATNPVVPTGTPGSPDSPAKTTTTPTVNLAGLQGMNVNAIMGANQIGVYSVNFVIPPNVTSGGIPTWITIGGVSSGSVTLQVFTGPVVSNVTNAASNISAGLPNAAIAQGAIFVLNGLNLGPAALSIAQSAFQSTSLSGTSINVTVGGTTVAALMYYTSATQVAALLPSNTPAGTGTVTVTFNGQVGAAAPITVVQNNPGIFTVTSDGVGAGIVTYPDYSLVSVAKASNCGGPYTTCGAANPGDVLTIWATGLGPVNGSDAAGAGLGVDMTGIDLKVLLGGVAAQVLFRGRGCCIGEDQIAFTVPDNVATGCAVPLALQVGSLVSNYTVVAIAPKGSRTCAPSNSSIPSSVIPLFTTGTAPINLGNIELSRQPNFNQQGQMIGNTDQGHAEFFNLTVPAALQPFMGSYLDDQPAGTCAAFNTSHIPDGGDRLNLIGPLDMGPGVKLTGPNGVQNLPPTGDNVTFGPGTYLTPGAYTVSGTGGKNVGSFSAPFAIPTPPVLTSPSTSQSVTVTRANGLTLTWSGGTGNSQIKILGQANSDSNFSLGASFQCVAAAGAGTFTIPPSVLLVLPTSSNAQFQFVPVTRGNFSASGLDVGLLSMGYATQIPATIQ
jgi:uncharacterized protein (TIGR03437 family)